MTNPVDDMLEDEKTAGFGSAASKAWQELPGHMVGALGMAGAAAAAGGVIGAARHLYDAATKSRDFRTMLEHNADLAEHPSPQHVEMAFTTLRTFAPAFSKDPLVAGTYVRQIAESPANAGGLILPAMQAQGPSFLQDMAQQGALQGLKFKDPKDLMAKDLEHQTSVERMRAGLRSEQEATSHERAKELEGIRSQHQSTRDDTAFRRDVEMEKRRNAFQQALADQRNRGQMAVERMRQRGK